jgi:hypothetical protein
MAMRPLRCTTGSASCSGWRDKMSLNIDQICFANRLVFVWLLVEALLVIGSYLDGRLVFPLLVWLVIGIICAVVGFGLIKYKYHGW